MVAAVFLVMSTAMAQDITKPALFNDEAQTGKEMLKAPLRAGSVPMSVRIGDVNLDGQVSIADVTDLINILLRGLTETQGSDVDGNGEVGIADVTTLINILLTGNMGEYTTSMAQTSLDDIYYSMRTAGWSTTGNTHQCFGVSAYNLMAEVMGDDMIQAMQGSGWYWYDAYYDVKGRYTNSYWRSQDLWTAYYTWIADANYILASGPDMTGSTAEKNYVLGQAYAIRAYSYFMLAQTFARTYKGHESDPCVPLFGGTYFSGSTGQPRSTVVQVYTQINSDIYQAINLLTGTTQQSINHMGYAVAQGLKSRIALVEENWSAAYDAAMEAITACGKAVQDVSDFMGMNDVSAGNVMWGADIPAEESGMYASLFAHLSITADAYGIRAPKQISKWLYNKMSATDARLAWWDPSSQYSTGGYAQKKFDFSDLSTMAGDYIYMRIEEMYLNAAEAACRQGLNATSRGLLMRLMSKRDSNYTCSKSGTQLETLTTDENGSLLEEILIQRRLELWGEDGRIYTIRRLHQGFERNTDYGWPTQLSSGHAWYDPECYAWVITIPQSEFDGNTQMELDTDQNPLGDYPGDGQHISFAEASITATTAKVYLTIPVTITRATTAGAYQAVITKTEGYSGFGTSYTVTFKDGQSSATVNIGIDALELNQDYTCVYTLSPVDAATGNPSLGEQITSTRIVVHCVNGDPTGQHISFTSSTLADQVTNANFYLPVPITRAISEGEYRAQVILENADEHITIDNEGIYFANGSTSANVYLSFRGMTAGNTYTCTLRLSPADVATTDPSLAEQITSIQIQVTYIDIEQAGTAVFADYTFDDGSSAISVPVYHIKGSNRYYLDKPYYRLYGGSNATDGNWYFTLNNDDSIAPDEGFWNIWVNGYDLYYNSTSYGQYCNVSQDGNTYTVNFLASGNGGLYSGCYFVFTWN